jgi:YVTN family beta-propeller protein
MPTNAPRCWWSLLAAITFSLSAAATARAQPFAYVLTHPVTSPPPGIGVPSLVVIDMATNARVTSIPLDVSCICYYHHALVASPDGSRVYASNHIAGTLSVVDTAATAVIATVPVGTNPTSLALAPDGSRVFVLRRPSSGPASLLVLDAGTLTPFSTISLGFGSFGGMVMSPDGRVLYISDFVGRVVLVDVEAGGVSGSIAVNASPAALDVTPDGALLYVPHMTTNSVTVINTATASVVAQIPFGPSVSYPHSARVSRDGGRVYVPRLADDVVSIINRSSNAVIGSIPAFNARTADFTPDGSRALVTASFSAVIVNVSTSAVLATVALSEQPSAGVIVPPLSRPNPPTSLAEASIVGNVVSLRWNAPTTGPAPTAYIVEGGLLPGQVLAGLPTGSAATSFTFAAPNGTFYVRVHSLNGSWRSTASNEIRISVPGPRCTAAPATPGHFVAAGAGNIITVRWDPVASASSYVLPVTGAFNGSVETGATTLSAAVAPGTYNIALAAKNDCGTGVATATAVQTVTISCATPATPGNFVAAGAGNTITVRWDPVASASGYVLFVTGAFSGSVETGATTLSAAVAPGTYNIALAAKNDCGTGVATAVQTVTIP